MKENYYGVIDFGGSYVKLMTANVANQNLNICYTTKVKTIGLKNGELDKVDEMNKCLDQLLKDPFFATNRIDKLLLILPSKKLKIYSKIKQISAINSPTTKEDIDALKNNVINSTVEEDRVCVGIYPVEYYHDGESVGKIQPVGDRFTTIGINAIVTSLPIRSARDIVDVIGSRSYDTIGYYTSQKANTILTLKQNEYKDGSIIIDIGGESVGISGYNNYLIKDYYKTNIGLDYVIESLANKYKTSYEIIEKIVHRYVSFNKSRFDKFIKFKLDKTEVNLEEFLIEYEKSFDNVLEEIKSKLSIYFTDTSNLFITGGGANIDGIKEKISQYLGTKVQIRNIDKIGLDDHSFYGCYGVLLDYLLANKVVKFN